MTADPPPQAQSGPAPAWIGRIFEPLYRAGITRRNRRYDRGIGVTRLPAPVISVGNLSVGGTGKTPMVAHIVSILLRAGFDPCIAMRGYVPRRPRWRRGPSSPLPASATPDEADGYHRMFPGVQVVAQKDRISGIRRWLAARGSGPAGDCAAPARPPPAPAVVLDDGFQHRRLARDLDIVLIDASRPPSRDRLLPAGWLRESIDSLARADLVVITHAELVRPDDITAIDASVRRVTGRPVDAVTRHVWTGLVTGAGDRERMLPLDWLLGRRVVGSCAIGNPAGFVHSLRATLAADSSRAGELAAMLVLPDHDPYDDAVQRVLMDMAREHEAQAIVVTDKDWSKLRTIPEDAWPAPVVRPVLAVVFDAGQAAFDARVAAAASSRARA